MKFQIEKEVIEKTTDCPYGHSCLETGKCGDRELCKIRCDIDEEILVLVSTDCAECPYRQPFGRMQICKCPTRNAIFTKYGA